MPAWDGKIDNLLLQCSYPPKYLLDPIIHQRYFFLRKDEFFSLTSQTHQLGKKVPTQSEKRAVLEFLNNLWGLRTKWELGCRTGPPGYYSMTELVTWNRFLGSLKVKKNPGSDLGPVLRYVYRMFPFNRRHMGCLHHLFYIKS